MVVALLWWVTAYGQRPAGEGAAPVAAPPAGPPVAGTPAATGSAGTGTPAAPAVRGWKQGIGWVNEWGPEDEVGALNASTPQSIAAALKLAKEGKVYDLGVTVSRNSFRWPGHNSVEVMSYRTPEGLKQQLDQPFTLPEVNPAGVAWHSTAVFISDNVGTQLDGLGHITTGRDNHWYNNFAEKQWGGDFGLRKCDAVTIPPIIARGVLLDVAGLKKVDALPRGYTISRVDVDAALAAQKVELRPGDVVFFRTGALRYWGKDGADHKKIGEHDTAGISLGTAKYLVQNFGAMVVGSDTTGVEVHPAEEGSDTFIPVHKYLLVEQGVHIAELHYLEDLARDKVYEFCYVCSVGKIQGATGGFALRPLALR